MQAMLALLAFGSGIASTRGDAHESPRLLLLSRSQWAVLENADFRADDLVLFVRNVVLRIVGLSAAMRRLGGRFPPVRRWEGDMVQLRVVPLCEAKVKKP